ncbi:MAG: site-2 protease family protein [Actinobacteria bacterium]|nr:site-2 protease family protein [Actinomycetota bacterium]
MTGTSWRIGEVAGVEIRVDVSWGLIALLVGYTFFVVLAAEFGATTTGTVVVAAIAMTLAFFASVLIHELAHSLLAKQRGITVRGITLFLFGGATHADLETKEPKDELVIAAVGPLTSFALAGVFWVLAQVPGSDLVAYAAGYLGWINLALAVFNLLPGFPLDGGRIVRSLVWRSRGDIVAATRVAARGGRIVGMVMIGIGVFELFFLGALVGGLWLMAIGWFLSQAATASFTHLQLKTVLDDVPASRLMTRDLVDVPAGITVQRAVDDYFMRHNYNAFPVQGERGDTGLVTMKRVRELPRDRWDSATVDEVMEPLSDMCTVSPSGAAGEVVDKLMKGEVGRVVVVDQGEVVGLITPRDLVRWLERARELGLSEKAMSLS